MSKWKAIESYERKMKRYEERIIIYGVPTQLCISNNYGDYDVSIVSNRHEDTDVLDYTGESSHSTARKVMKVVKKYVKSSWCILSLVSYEYSPYSSNLEKSQLIYSQTFHSLDDPKILYLLKALGTSSNIVRHWSLVMLLYCLFHKKVNVFFFKI